VNAIRNRIVKMTIVKMLRISVGASMRFSRNASAKKRKFSARTNRYARMPMRINLTMLMIVVAEGDGLVPIRCSSSVRIEPSSDQNR
jgi:hypothetical protein